LEAQVQRNQWFSCDFVVVSLDGPNSYQFALNNPISYSDPMGLYVPEGGEIDFMQSQMGISPSERLDRRVDATMTVLSNPYFQGSAQVIGGCSEAIAGVAGVASVGLSVPGAAMVAHGSDLCITGFGTLFIGESQESLFVQNVRGGLESAGMSPTAAQWTTVGLDLGVGVGSTAWFARLQSSPRTISIVGFRGAGRVDDLLAADAPHPYVVTGHVGYSFDSGKTIYGFGPSVPSNMSAHEAVQSLRAGASYFGRITNDTDSFEAVFANPAVARDGAKQVVYQLDLQVSAAQFHAIRRSHAAFGLNRPIPSIQYGFPGQNQCFNCASFPGFYGLPLPETTGNMRLFMQRLQELGRPWSPVN
jgi:filamentous hemagglutinin